jgi:hypothetical protein
MRIHLHRLRVLVVKHFLKRRWKRWSSKRESKPCEWLELFNLSGPLGSRLRAAKGGCLWRPSGTPEPEGLWP